MFPNLDNESNRGMGTGSSRKSKRGWISRSILCLVILGAVITNGYLLDDLFKGWNTGKFMGLNEPTVARTVYNCPSQSEYKSDKPGTHPTSHRNLEKLESGNKAEAATANDDAGSGKSKQEGKILYWVDPMNPALRSDKPGKAPCGMDLVPVYAEGGPGSESLPRGSVKISPQKQQLIGVQYGEVREQPLTRTIRTVGRLAYDETRISRINTKVAGWIDQVFVDFTGKLVKRGQPLISVYSPDLVSAQQELIIAKKAKDVLGNSQFKDVSSSALSLYDSSRERLLLWDISPAQIAQIEKSGTPSKTLSLYSPIDGFVLTRSAYKGQRITPETELYSIADLSKIWVLADVYEYELPMIQMGQTAVMTLSYLPGKTYTGKVTYIYPELEPTTRTLKVRLEFSNRDFELKPDMYANVELSVDYGRKLAIPQEAVLDSGSEQMVFVAREDGYFEPRKVTLGQQVGNLFVVLAGLQPGERVVTSANFLIDSESQLKSALEGMGSGTQADQGSGKQ